jgi:Trk K+ transport system NAD-binding subunit
MPVPPAAAYLVAMLLVGAAVGADEADRPEILHVAVPGRLIAGHSAQARLTYRARQANVVAVILAIDDLDGPRRVTSQREIGVIAAAFGREEGDLVLPLGFTTPGRKRMVFTLLTDEREESDAVAVEVEVAP